MPNVELFLKSEGYIEPFPGPTRKTKLRQIHEASRFHVIIQQGSCIVFQNDIFPDLIVANWNTKLYFPLDSISATTYVYGDITYTYKTLTIDEIVMEEFDIVLGRKFFSETNLAKQRDSVEKIIRTIIKLW